MKPFKLLSFLSAVLATLAFVNSASAQLVAYDDAAQYYISANWTNNSNQGFGFTPWQFFTSGANSHGHYIGNGYAMGQATNVTGTNYTNISWGLFANGSGNINQSIACRGFSNSLGTNTFKLQWAAKGAGNITTTNAGLVHGFCGFMLRNGNSTNFSTDILNNPDTSARFTLYFLDGASPSTIYVLDGSGGPISLTGTSFSNLGRGLSGGLSGTNAVEAEITVGPDGNTYHLVLKDIVQNKTLYTLDSVLAGSGTLDSVAMFDRECTGGGGSFNGDQNYNRMQIAVPTLVPPTIVNVVPTNGTLYLDPTLTNITFEVDSFNSTVASNFVTVTLNGVSQTSLSYNTALPTTALLVTCGGKITANNLYTMVIVAQDANGNFATNTSTFNTFLPSDVYFDAADYNFGAGNSFPDSAPQNLYANLVGTNGIDYFDSSNVASNTYRPDDLVQILSLDFAATGDPIDHANEHSGGSTIYNLGFTDIGDWENYTRSVPVATNYSIYARAASTTGGQFEVEKLVSPFATTTNQPLAALGRVNFLNTGGSKVFTGQLTPVVDIFTNTVVINLSGTNTFRQTATSSRIYNIEYFVVVPVTNAASPGRPYFSVASPAPGATGVLLDTPLSFTIVNRNASLNPATLQVSVNNTNITSSGTLTTNALGSTFSYSPAIYFPANTTNTVKVVFTDTGTATNVTVTNGWSFVTINASNTVIPTAFAQSLSPGATSGFGINMFKIADSAPVVLTLSNAWRELAGLIIDVNSGTPYLNTATNPANGSNFYLETNVIAYDITGTNNGAFTFTNRTTFPYIPATGTANNFVMQAQTYLQLTNGSYHLAVRSDDGFELTTGPTPASTNLALGLFDLGRANTTPSDIYFTIQTNGLYPMSLFYVQESFGGNVEFYSIKDGTPILVNDPTNPNSIKAYATLGGPATPVTILGPGYSGGTASFHFLTQSGHSHFVEFKASLTDPTWSPLQTVVGNDSEPTNITDSTGGNIRFYRVRTQ